MKNLFLTMTFLVCGFVTSTFAQQPVAKVFILAGQSNMQGQAVVDLDHPQHYNGGRGILQDVIDQPENKTSMAHLRNRKGEWTVRKDVWIRYQTETELKIGPLGIGYSGYEGKHHFGPELQFGHVIGHRLDDPVLLIKTAWGGKSLAKDFRPPGSGGTVGPYYKKMLSEVQEALQNVQDEIPAFKNRDLVISGFVWQQGWNDMVKDEFIDEYENNLINLIHDVRKEWNTPDLPVVVGELGNGGPDASEQMKKFRAAQRSAVERPEFNGTVRFVETSQYARAANDSPNTGHGHHWFGNAESYFLIGDALGKAMIRLIDGNRPRVLILGDSISIGYTPLVRKLLSDDAVVYRPTINMAGAENCAGTDKGILNIDRWLKAHGGNWDVIHFNFGLHDLKHVQPDNPNRNSNDPTHPQQSSPAEYRQQLLQIVAKLKETDAALILATTTPVPDGGVKPYRDVSSPLKYNAVAVQIAKENGIDVNDLYELTNSQLEKVQQPVNVHFNSTGNKILATQVAEHIRLAIAKRNQKDN